MVVILNRFHGDNVIICQVEINRKFGESRLIEIPVNACGIRVQPVGEQPFGFKLSKEVEVRVTGYLFDKVLVVFEFYCRRMSCDPVPCHVDILHVWILVIGHELGGDVEPDMRDDVLPFLKFIYL